MPNTVLSVNNIHTFYGQIEALKGISAHVEEGEIVTLIGANGAGKSTTLKTISGLISPRSGSIEFQGETISGMKVHDVTAKGVIQVPEGRRIFPRMTVEENLEMGAFLRPKKDPAVKESMDWVFELFPRLKERRTQKGGTLSGGEQQMLATARGLMADPKLLMLDEPSMGLAPVVVELIFDTIVKLNDKGNHDPARGAERRNGFADSRPRLRSRDRVGSARGHGQGAPHQRAGPQDLSGRVLSQEPACVLAGGRERSVHAARVEREAPLPDPPFPRTGDGPDGFCAARTE